MTVTLLANSLSGVGMRVAETITDSAASGESGELGESAAAAAATPAPSDRAVAQRSRSTEKWGINIRPPHMTNPTGRHSGYPQPPAHPGRKQDDGARQVSWLPGRRSRSPSRGHRLSGSMNDRSPVTV